MYNVIEEVLELPNGSLGGYVRALYRCQTYHHSTSERLEILDLAIFVGAELEIVIDPASLVPGLPCLDVSGVQEIAKQLVIQIEAAKLLSSLPQGFCVKVTDIYGEFTKLAFLDTPRFVDAVLAEVLLFPNLTAGKFSSTSRDPRSPSIVNPSSLLPASILKSTTDRNNRLPVHIKELEHQSRQISLQLPDMAFLLVQKKQLWRRNSMRHSININQTISKSGISSLAMSRMLAGLAYQSSQEQCMHASISRNARHATFPQNLCDKPSLDTFVSITKSSHWNMPIRSIIAGTAKNEPPSHILLKSALERSAGFAEHFGTLRHLEQVSWRRNVRRGQREIKRELDV